MSYRYLLIEKSDGVATVTINRPEALNALNGEVLSDLAAIFHELDEDPSVLTVVLTGAGEKAFVAGADIKAMAQLTPLEAHRFSLKGQETMLAAQRMTKPLIAAVNGFALGGGLELALACDFIYASVNAKLGFPEVGLGLIPGFGGTQNLARLIGANKARELIFSGRMISAEKGLAWGIVNEVFPGDILLAKARETALEIGRQGPVGVKFAKEAISRGLDMGIEEGLRYEASLFGVLLSSGDSKEGLDAFLTKRKAGFRGK